MPVLCVGCESTGLGVNPPAAAGTPSAVRELDIVHRFGRELDGRVIFEPKNRSHVEFTDERSETDDVHG